MPESRTADGVIDTIYAAVNRGDLADLLAYLDGDVEFTPLPVPRKTECRGHAAVRRWWLELEREGLSLRIEIEATHDVGENVVAATGWCETGISRFPFAAVHRIQDGKVTRCHHYFSGPDRLRAIGLISASA